MISTMGFQIYKDWKVSILEKAVNDVLLKKRFNNMHESIKTLVLYQFHLHKLRVLIKTSFKLLFRIVVDNDYSTLK